MKVAGLLALSILCFVVPSAFAESACPAEFDSDDPKWVMTAIGLYNPPNSEGLVKTIQRSYLYQPDPFLRLRGVKGTCQGTTFSFVIKGRETRVLKMLFGGDVQKDTFTFFLTEDDKTWKHGRHLIWRLSSPGKGFFQIFLGDENQQPIAVRNIPLK